MNLASLDLNLLLSLDALLRQRNVTRAAKQMGLSQPTVSAALSRLRRHFGDELLTRVGNGYQLTPLATQLSDLTHIAVSSVERVFTAAPVFEPGTSTREFTLLASDYVVAILGHTIADLFAEEAPHARLRFRPITPAVVERADQALLTTDLMLLPHVAVTALSHTDLYRDEWVCVVSATNPLAGTGLTVDALRTLPWVATYHGTLTSTLSAQRLRTLGIEPHVQVASENFLTAPALVAGSDRIALLPRRLVELLALDVGVRALPCPFEAGPLIEAMWWHPVHDDDPQHSYLRDVVMRATRHAIEADLTLV